MSVWNCPLCAGELLLHDNTWSCNNKHSFDVAKEGYVNLLPAQQKNSKQPGDNKLMVNGRRTFLQAGHYQPLADKIGQIFARQITSINDKSNIAFFDAGCGEGYYMDRVSQVNQHKQCEITFSGVDISKFAIQKAAKKYADCHFAVASTFQLPVAAASQNTVLQVFAPSSNTEIQRILKPQGIWITVNPAANHLHEIKQALYDQPSENKASPTSIADFQLLDRHNLSFEVQLNDPAQRENLLLMTPYYWSATPDKKSKLINNLAVVTTDFDIKVYGLKD